MVTGYTMDPLWAELINSEWHDYLGRGRDEDRLDKPGWLAALLARWKLPAAAARSPATRQELRRLRGLLRRLALKLKGDRPLTSRDLASLNGFLRRDAVVRQVCRRNGGFALGHVLRDGSLDTVLSEIAASFAGLLVEGDPRRIRMCENQDCRWIFYDRSRNRTRRWCEGPTGCGNLLKVRRHRARRRKAQDSTAEA